MRHLRVFSVVAVLLAASQLCSSSEVWATAISWGTAGEWLERCELGERYARADSVGEDPKMGVSEAVEANLCLGFLSGFELGSMWSELRPLIERYGDNPPATAVESLERTICVSDPYDEVVAQLVDYLSSEAVDPGAEFSTVIFDFYGEHYRCEEPAPDWDSGAKPNP